MTEILENDALLVQLRGVLAELFEIEPALVVPAARLKDDLDLDSIDAVDLVLKLRELTGSALTPRDFKDARTVAEVLVIVGAAIASR